MTVSVAVGARVGSGVKVGGIGVPVGFGDGVGGGRVYVLEGTGVGRAILPPIAAPALPIPTTRMMPTRAMAPPKVYPNRVKGRKPSTVKVTARMRNAQAM